MLTIRFGEGAVTSSALLFSPAMSLRRVMVKIPALNDWECGSVPAAFNSHRWAGELHFYRHLLAALRRGIHSYCQWDRPEHAVVYALPVILLQENNDIPFLLCSRSDVREKSAECFLCVRVCCFCLLACTVIVRLLFKISVRIRTEKILCCVCLPWNIFFVRSEETATERQIKQEKNRSNQPARTSLTK